MKGWQVPPLLPFHGIPGTWRSAATTAAVGAVAALSLGLAGCSSASEPTTTPAPTIQPTSAEAGETGAAETALKNGAELYASNCQVCHGDRSGRGATGGAPTHSETGHTWHHPGAQLKDWVLNGKLGFGSPGMPPLGDQLTGPEVDAVLAFIKSWWTPEQRESQADVSQRYQEALDNEQQQQ